MLPLIWNEKVSWLPLDFRRKAIKMQIFGFTKSLSVLAFGFFFVAICHSENTSNRDQEKKPDAKNYEVTVGILPIDVNPDALIRPNCQIIEIHDENGTQKMMALSYPVRKKLLWSPDTGKGVVLKIEIGHLELEKKYPGRLGFPEFLNGFKDGKRIYKAEEFSPEESKVLKEYNIEYIRLNLRISGAEPVIRFLDK